MVDNSSTDNTKEVIEELFQTSPVKINHTCEQQKGLSFARNTGIEHASGEIIAFIDDDAEADISWLGSLVSAFDDPEVMCAGGVVKGIWSQPRPEWLPDWALDYLSIRDFQTFLEKKVLTYPHYPVGTNIAFRREAFEKFGKFSENLGRLGSHLMSNEEMELCYRIERAGKIIKLVPEAVVHHYIPPERLTKEWFYQRLYAQGCSEAILDINLKRINIFRLLQCFKNILMYFFSIKPDFSAKCRYKEAIGYIKHHAVNLTWNPSESLRKIPDKPE